MPAPLQTGAIQVSPADDYNRLQNIDVGYFNPDAFGAFTEEILTFNPTAAISRYSELRDARGADFSLGQLPLVGATILSQYENRDEETFGGSPVISAEEANQRAGDLGLNFDGPIPERALELMMERKQRENRRQFILSHRRQGAGQVVGDLFFGLALSAVDPLNVASAFIPVVGETRYAALAGRIGTLGARVSRGAVEGAVGAALVEPIVYGAARYEQADYTLQDSLMNVAFGTALGGGFHVGLGALGDAIGRTRPQTREATLRGAIAQFVQGRDVNVAPLIHSDPAFNDPAHPFYERIQRESERVQRSSARLNESQAEMARIDAEIERARSEMGSAAADREQLVRDRAESGANLVERHIDETTGQRLRAIEEELNQPGVDNLRRATLEREQRLLGEGVQDEIPLAQGRADAEIRALEAVRKREEGRIQDAVAARTNAEQRLSRASKSAAKANRRYQEALRAGKTPEQIATEGLRWADQNKAEATRMVDQMAESEINYQRGMDPVDDQIVARREQQARLEDQEQSNTALEDEIADLDGAIDQLIAEGELDADAARGRLSAEEAEAEVDLWTRASRAVSVCLLRG